MIIALTWGALLVVAEDLLLGQLMAGYSLLAGIVPSAERLVQAWAGFQETAVSAGRFRDLTLAPIQSQAGAPEIAIRGGLRLEALSLDWPNGKRQLHDLNFTLPAGRVTGLWGPNGSGKTTLVRVLNRSYLPTEGRILVDGTPAEELELDAYRRSVAVFHSEVHLFSGSVAQNVLLGRSDGSQGSGFSRLEDLGFSSFLDRFPARWSDSIGEGGRRLSSGERQVLGLMRALAGSPQVLLVDEGLSGTDAESGRLIIDTLLQYGRKRAVLLVSHDARILRRTDHLLVLAQGRIQAEGLRARFSPTRPQTASWAGVPPVVAP